MVFLYERRRVGHCALGNVATAGWHMAWLNTPVGCLRLPHIIMLGNRVRSVHVDDNVELIYKMSSMYTCYSYWFYVLSRHSSYNHRQHECNCIKQLPEGSTHHPLDSSTKVLLRSSAGSLLLSFCITLCAARLFRSTSFRSLVFEVCLSVGPSW